MAASVTSQLKGGRNHISIGYLSPLTDLGNIIGIDKPASGTEWWTINNNSKLWTIVGNLAVTDDAYAAGWDGSVNVPTKNAVYDKIESLKVTSGTYSPTLTAVTNVAATTTLTGNYIRVLNHAIVSFYIGIDPTAIGAIALGISIPIASDFGAITDCTGSASSETYTQCGTIQADATNNRAQLTGLAVNAGNAAWGGMFCYRVI